MSSIFHGERVLLGRGPEREALHDLGFNVRKGRSQVLVLRGEAGVGKTALLDHLVAESSGCRIARVSGVESEMQFAFAGLHQLCAPMLDLSARLPTPQRHALATALGLNSGPPPDRFFVGLAVLSLLSEAAEEQPLMCIVDDVQWLDQASAHTLAFVARRLLAEPIAFVFAVREPTDQTFLAGLPDVKVSGLSPEHSFALLDTAIKGPIDQRVREQFVVETRGNPLALLELPRGLTPHELAGGFGFPVKMPLSNRIEESFLRRLDPLPAETRMLILTAAAEPLGDVDLLRQAADRLGLDPMAGFPAERAGLLELGSRVRFRHPMVRAVAYRTASPEQRRVVHRALADSTDPELSRDRRAWHLAQAAFEPDEDVAAELERSAGVALARGGHAAAAAFLERAATLTPDAGRRAGRALDAARASRDAGAFDAAIGLLAIVESGPSDPLRSAHAKRLRGLIAFDERRDVDAARWLLESARRLDSLDAAAARETHLEALVAAIWANDSDSSESVRRAAEAASTAPRPADPRAPGDLVLDALATRIAQGYEPAATRVARALDAVCDIDVRLPSSGTVSMTWMRASSVLSLDIWSFESWYELAVRQVQIARDAGALRQLQFALNFLATAHVAAGDLQTAAVLIAEDRSISKATGHPTVAYGALSLAALTGDEQAVAMIEASRERAMARPGHRTASIIEWVSSTLYNGLGRHEAARDAARRVFEQDVVGYGTFVVSEMAEGASRSGDTRLVRAALEWMGERTSATPTAWALGIAARVRGLLGEGDADEMSFRESIDHLGRTPLRVELARSHLLYGEWLRSRRRLADAREELQTAHGLLTKIGAGAFAQRARNELIAAGADVRSATTERRNDLTPQEVQIARLATEGRTNPDIGGMLFISPRTVEWHLGKVFAKLGISSRKELGSAMSLLSFAE